MASRALQKERREKLIESKINPDWFYRKADACRFYGLGPTELEKQIKAGNIPKPVKLTDSGRACGWFGRDILEWQDARRKASAA